MTRYGIDMGDNEKVTVITESKNLRSLPFKPSEDQLSTGKAWEDWLEEIEREFRYFRITSPLDKKDAIIIYGGQEIARLAKSLPDPEDPDGELDVYQKLRKKLNDYFIPKRNKHYARYIFLKMPPDMGETTVAYATRLREKAHDCDFGTNCDERILEHLIQTLENQVLIQKCISKSWTLQEFLMDAGQIEDISLQMRDMKIGPDNKDIAKVEESRRRNPRAHRNTGNNNRRRHYQLCSNCGFEAHSEGKNCPAYGKKCNNCSRYNHFAAVCRSDKSKYRQDNRQPGGGNRNQRKRRVKRTAETDVDSEESSDEEFLTKSIAHMQIKRVRKAYGLEKTIPLMVNDIHIRAEPDTGADVNVMDEYQYKALLHRSESKMELQKSQTKLRTLQNDLPIKGEFEAILRNQTCGKRTKFLVIKGKINSPPLISKNILIELGMLQIKEDGSFANQNDMRIPGEILDIRTVTTNKSHQAIQEITNKFSSVFEGIGKIRDMKNNKELYVQFSMKANAAPVAQRPRPVPYYLQKPLKLWLDQCVEDGLFEGVPADEPVTWCSPVVVQPKPKYLHVSNDELQPHMIRACIDLRVPNKFMERNRITQGPVVEDFIYKFHECVVFSKLDLRSGYHQLMLHPDSRAVVTFSTPWGNYRPNDWYSGPKRLKTCLMM